MILIVLIVLFALCVAAVIALRKAGGGNFPWVQFYVKGKEAGFSFSEVNLLRKVAVENHLENPTSLFWSIKQLDRCIKGTIIKFRAESKIDTEPFSSFLFKLFDFRKSVELNLPKYTLGLKSSRKIVTHQRMKITLPGVGVYNVQVVENLRKYLAVSYPEGPKLPPGFSWKGQKVNVYFWRQEDAGYVFESKVLEDYIEQKYPIIHIAHSEDLIRSQKRNSVRVEVNLPASLYPLRGVETANENVETSKGLKSRLVDISEDGAALLIGGKAKVGLPIKLQFALAKTPVVMCGIVKGIGFDQKKNQSVLHIQALAPSAKMKNHILSYVYNIFGEREPVNPQVKKPIGPAASAASSAKTDSPSAAAKV
jgi:c-di-GMP-binding flagellar brake protein YcgR